MKHLRIAYFTHDSISEGIGRSQVLALCTSLAKMGVEVNLFTFEKSCIDSTLKDLASSKNLKWTPFEFHRNSQLAPIERINILRKVQGEFDLIHARGDLPALAAILRKEEPVFWDIRSLWAEQRQVLNPRKFNPVTVWSLNRLTSFISQRVAGYNTLTESILPYLNAKFPKLPNNHSVISTCVDTDFFRFNKILPQKPQALLSGTYNKIYDETLINKFNTYMNFKYKHSVIWARSQESDSEFQDLGQSKTLTLTYDDMPSMIAGSSYGIAVCKNQLGQSLSAAMPTKIAEFLSVGRPVIVNSNLGDVEKLLIDQGVAIALNSTADIPEAAKQLISLLDDPRTPDRCRHIAEEKLSLNNAATTYSKIYSDLLIQREN